MHTGNLLGQIPSPLPNEVFTDLVSTNHFRIERILSQGQQTPTGEWFDQDEHEWVALIAYSHAWRSLNNIHADHSITSMPIAQ